MIKQLFFRFAAVVCVLAALTILSPLTITAHAATKPSCAVTDVTLHGTAAPTVKCQVTTIKYSSNVGDVRPNAGVEPLCASTSDLTLYWNGPIGVHPNYLLCIIGSGVLNLNQQLDTSPGDQLRNWNDQASAWWTGCNPVTFYVDINQGGANAYEPGSIDGLSSPQGSFPLKGVGNDQLSSVYLWPTGSPSCA